MRSKTIFVGAAATLALFLSPTLLLAAGGGGGGSTGSSAPSESAPRYDAAAEYQKGTAALKAERYADAATAFRRTLEVVPRNANAQYLLGFAYMQQGDYKKARGPLEKAVKYDEKLVPAWRDLAITRHKLGEADKAQTALDALVARQTACAATCTDQAALDAAVAAVKAAMAGSAQSAHDGLKGFGLADARTGDTLYLAAVGLINEHRYAEALDELAVAERDLGPHPDILTYQGFAYRKLNRFDLAETYYRRALAVAPDHRGALEYYGELKVERGDLAGARAHLARLDRLCAFGCYEAEELGRWIAAAPAS